MRHDFSAAEAAYGEVLSGDSSTEHRVDAAVGLANIGWRVRRDTIYAREFLRAGAAIDAQDEAVPLERARMRIASGNYRGARAAAAEALALASEPGEEARAASALASGIIEPVLHRVGVTSVPLVVSEPERAALREIVPVLTQVVRSAPGVLEPARLLVLAGALTGDGAAMLEGWRSYYLIGTDRPGSSLLAGPRELLTALLPDWAGPAAPLRDRLALVHALAASRFFDAAALLALLPGIDGTVPARSDAEAAEVVAYSRFLREVSEFADEFYRRTALGEAGDLEAFRLGILAAARHLWPHLVWTGEPVPLSWERLAEQLGARFGTFYSLGVTSGYPSLHMGHTVVDEERVVRQYGRDAEVRFISLDAIVSNGFQSWAWGGRASTGGWGTATRIVQIRPSYAEGPLAAWRAVADPAVRARAAAKIRADSVADMARARDHPVAYFPSVPARLLRDGRDQLADSLRAEGLGGTDLEAAFKREYAHAILESSIFGHEGRHAIVQKHEPALSSEELEFRGKISQVIFAPRPRLGAVSGTFQPNIADETAHGQANARIMHGLLTWMRAHASEIQKLDPAAALLPQLPLLTDAQLLAAFASMDPLGESPPVPQR